MSTVTASYSVAHDVLRETARRQRLVLFDIRLLLAIHERGGVGRTDELALELSGDAAGVRRSSLALRATGLIRADAGPGTSRTKRGTRARLVMTGDGAALAREVLDDIDERNRTAASTEGAPRA